MRVLNVRNVQDALPRAIKLLYEIGALRSSRNGDVLYGGPVTTVYSIPLERVIFHPERDANPFFHLYESLWMLQGRHDVEGPSRFTKNVEAYTDDGITFHGAYGHRWRTHFGFDQLNLIARRLRDDKTDRRCVLQMWDVNSDLDVNSKDLPCNTVATFQRGANGRLDLVVFNRSNDIIWGAYGANAVQFGALLEYMAIKIGCSPGSYHQVSVNWHGYLNTLEKVKNLRPGRLNEVYNQYEHGVYYIPMPEDVSYVDDIIAGILNAVDSNFTTDEFMKDFSHPWAFNMYVVLKAHHMYKLLTGTNKYLEPIKWLELADPKCDWVVAAKDWFTRRLHKWAKNEDS